MSSNKTLKAVVLTGILIASLALLRRNKQKATILQAAAASAQQGNISFAIKTPTAGDPTNGTKYWQEGTKYYSQCTSALARCMRVEITKADFDANYKTYLAGGGK